MSDVQQPQVEQTDKQASYKAGGGLVVQPLPDEAGIPLRQDDFITLCSGDIHESRANRDLCFGVSFTALGGLLAVVAAIDWDTVSKAGHLKLALMIIPSVLLLISACGFMAGALIHNSHMKHTVGDSPYSRLKARMLKAYEAQSQR